jgi:F0F1-type ATP synthase delta subunit
MQQTHALLRHLQQMHPPLKHPSSLREIYSEAFHVTSAYKLSKKEEDEIIKDLSDKYKTTVSIDIEIDENLVGGVVIKEG